MKPQDKEKVSESTPEDENIETLPGHEKVESDSDDNTESSVEIPIPQVQIEEQEIADDPVRIYLHEIGRVSLLTAEDEQVLSRRIAEGKRISEIKKNYFQEHLRQAS